MVTDVKADRDIITNDELGLEGRATPIPVRYRWLKRIVAWSGVLLVVLVGLRSVWGIVARHQLEAEVDRIRAAGEPVLPEDFGSTFVPDEENAVVLIRAAVAASTREDSKLLDLVLDSERWAQNGDEALAIITSNTEALRVIREARGRPGVDWGIRFRMPLPIPKGLSEHRGLVCLVAGAAISASRDGDHYAAVERIRDGLMLTAALERRPRLISHLVALAEACLCAQAVEQVAPALIVGDGSSVARPPRQATRRQVEMLIDDLLDETGGWESLVTAAYCERMVGVASTRSAAYSNVSWREALLLALLEPLHVTAVRRRLRYSSDLAQAFGHRDWPAIKAAEGEIRSWASGPFGYLNEELGFGLPAIWGRSMQHCHAIAMRRMAAIALAIRLYELEHGRRPDRLADLAPSYLTAIPSDPFTADGQTFRYLPTAQPPVLYSVGVDGLDDRGVFETTFVPMRDAGDIPFFLNGDRPRAK